MPTCKSNSVRHLASALGGGHDTFCHATYTPLSVQSDNFLRV